MTIVSCSGECDFGNWKKKLKIKIDQDILSEATEVRPISTYFTDQARFHMVLQMISGRLHVTYEIMLAEGTYGGAGVQPGDKGAVYSVPITFMLKW
jgi:hypothetical protein